ncbi:hypothetical protein Trydic_g4699 [Trypoxylus dichotomus]
MFNLLIEMFCLSLLWALLPFDWWWSLLVLFKQFGAKPQYKKLGITNIAVYFCSTPERLEPLDLEGLDVASVRMATLTACCRTLVRGKHYTNGRPPLLIARSSTGNG